MKNFRNKVSSFFQPKEWILVEYPKEPKTRELIFLILFLIINFYFWKFFGRIIPIIPYFIMFYLDLKAIQVFIKLKNQGNSELENKLRYVIHSNKLYKEIQPKGLRHSHASLLINELNANPLAVQKQLGHSDIQITLGTYSHLYPTIDREVADNLKNIIQIKTSNKSLTNWNGNQYIKQKSDVNKKILNIKINTKNFFIYLFYEFIEFILPMLIMNNSFLGKIIFNNLAFG